MRFQFIAKHCAELAVRCMCRVLDVSPSGYYTWHTRPASAREMANRGLVKNIEAVYNDSYGIYGSLRIYRELKTRDVVCSENRVARLMRLYHIRAKQTQAYIGLGILARRREEYGKAMDYYIEALKLDPRSGHAWSSAAIVALKLSDDAKAVEFAEKGWELEQSDPVIAANLCIAYHYAGRIKDRDRMYKQAQRMKYRSMETIDKIISGELSMRA